MEDLLPKIKTIRVMLQEVGEQQEAVFRMAFKCIIRPIMRLLHLNQMKNLI